MSAPFAADTSLVRRLYANSMDPSGFDRWLAAHDAEVAAKARREHRTAWANYINEWESTVGAPMCTPATIAHALRMNPTPFGRAAGIRSGQ